MIKTFTRDYCTIYRGPGFLVVIWFGSSPIPLSPLRSTSCLSFPVFLFVAGRAYLRERRVGGGGGAESYDRVKAWPFMNDSTTYVSLSLQSTGTRLFIGNILLYHQTFLSIHTPIQCKKRLATFPFPAGMSLTKLSLGGIIWFWHEYKNFWFYWNENYLIKIICHYNKTSLHTIFCQFFCQTQKCLKIV